MPRFRLALVSLLAVLATAKGLAQTAEGFSIQRLPSFDQSFQMPLTQGLSLGDDKTLFTDTHVRLDGSAEVPSVVPPGDFLGCCHEDLLGYRHEEFSDQPPPLIDQAPQVPPTGGTSPAGTPPATDAPIKLDKPWEAHPVASLRDFWGYRYSTGALDWIPGNGNQFGMFSIVWDHYQNSGFNDGIGVGTGLSLPLRPDTDRHATSGI